MLLPARQIETVVARCLAVLLACALLAKCAGDASSSEVARDGPPPADINRLAQFLPPPGMPAHRGPQVEGTAYLIALRLAKAGWPVKITVLDMETANDVARRFRVQDNCVDIEPTYDTDVDIAAAGYCMWNKLGYAVPRPEIVISP